MRKYVVSASRNMESCSMWRLFVVHLFASTDNAQRDEAKRAIRLSVTPRNRTFVSAFVDTQHFTHYVDVKTASGRWDS